MMLRLLALTLALGGSALAQSSPQTPPAPPAAPTPQTTPAPPQTPPADALPDAPSITSQAKPPVVPTGPTVVIDTTSGRLTCKLYDKQAPVTVANFIGLAEGTKDWTDPKTLQKVHNQPFYNGTTFHRVIPGFMIQGGDRLGDGRGDPGYLFQDEFDPTLTFDEPGRLAMANSGPNTNGSQFFITEVPVPQLNGKHTIFGQCDSHTVLMVATIARVQRDENDKPLTPVVINKITIVRDGQPMPPEPPQPTPTAPTPAPPAQ
ncbi:MAG TPA: peptidylprolyl isomerase [Edaphobacter sp.]|jgi:peptidyl-prolyl cis-trans isomerase A (cyclophilin A)|nr:peptidylprolyl isomerase [Edaphobacter sp.]